MNLERIEYLFDELRKIQTFFYTNFQVDDIYSNSKIYEFIMANRFNHKAIPGHSGSRDALDEHGNEIEYKHFKESSSNHTWTFNDFSDTTIEKLKTTPYVYFVYVDDVNFPYPGQVKWSYIARGTEISKFLSVATTSITNKRKMINVSVRNLESIGIKRTIHTFFDPKNGFYGKQLGGIISIALELESLTGTKGILTSNKIWELLVAIKLNHKVNSEQGGREGAHDAYDDKGNLYEYKVSKNHSWNFQDISENVLNKYLSDKAIILAVVDKKNLKIEKIYEADPKLVVSLLRKKLNNKINSYSLKNKEVRRLQVSLSKGDLITINSKSIV
jgi:hypothetical protein